MSIKLMILDDEDSIRNNIAKYIQLHTDRFDKIYLAENGQEAIEKIILYKPQIMLLDIQIPIKNGNEGLKEVKKLGLTPATIILSGFDEFEYAQQALRYEAKEYLLKPCRSTEILSCLHKIADGLKYPAGVLELPTTGC